MHTEIETPVGPNLRFDGYYLYASFFLTGEHRPYQKSSGTFTRLKPKNNFSMSGQGWGAWEVVARYSSLDLNDNGIDGGQLDDYTVGINWYLNPQVRAMFNYVYANSDGGALDGDAHIFQSRIQYDF